MRMDSQQLLIVARLYAEIRQITMATLGTYLVRDAKFFIRLPEGRVTIRRAARAGERLSQMWPADTDWPSDIPRPAPTESPSPEPDHGEAA